MSGCAISAATTSTWFLHTARISGVCPSFCIAINTQTTHIDQQVKKKIGARKIFKKAKETIGKPVAGTTATTTNQQPQKQKQHSSCNSSRYNRARCKSYRHFRRVHFDAWVGQQEGSHLPVASVGRKHERSVAVLFAIMQS
jgi:hypothetical protein